MNDFCWHDARTDLPLAGCEVLAYNAPFFAIGYVSHRGGWYLNDDDELLGVTHWMPLPPRPEVQP